jgi:ABC-type nickel/cobalt efflux system permease component RcnA
VVGLANSLVSWLISILGVIAVIVMVYAGFKMVTSAGDEGAWTKAKELFTNVVIGIVLILAAWLIVDTLLKGLTGRGLDDWTQELQVSAPNPNNTSIVGGLSGCANCATIEGIPCKNSNSCSVSSEYAERLSGLSGSGIEITEAWPPTRTHQAACHQNGTCTDVVFADRNFTPDRVQAFQSLASQNGFKAVYEPPAGVSCSGYTNCLSYNTTRSTGHHFSLYMQ